MRELTPHEVVEELDKHIVGQNDAKRAAAIALRNRWRWKQLPDELRREVTPKNILMIGPTGVGKTEICRRLAKLTGAPFVKVEASKYTEVGYYGRDVESIVRDLVEAAITLVRQSKRKEVEEQARERVEDRLLDLLVPPPTWVADSEDEEDNSFLERHERTVDKFRQRLQAGELEDHKVNLIVEQRNSPVQVFTNMGMEQMDMDLQGMLDRMMPKQSSEREVKVSEARDILLDQEIESLMDKDAINEEGIRLAESTGMVFIDEIDKVCGPSESRGADVSRSGVQRDLLPIVEGCTIQTRYGAVSTDHVMFIAAGAFHRSKPSDLMPELQGRFPIRVELQDLTRDDFVRILTEPNASLTRQYEALLGVDKVDLKFTKDGIDAIAGAAWQVNQTTQNIGARRLQTIMERLLESLSFEAPPSRRKKVTVNEKYVKDQLDQITQDEDLSRFIL